MRFLTWLVLATAALAQPSYYRLAIDQDALSGAPDFSFLNHTLGPADQIVSHDGHFYRVGADLQPSTGDDERVRFFGMNLAFGANFPDGGDSVRIAKRLRRLGVNLVRLHHMDSSPDTSASNAGSLLMLAPYPTLNGVAVSRLRVFLDALKAEGIYCDLNLHVGYTFSPLRDGVPVGDIPSQSKPLHMISPRMIELQQQYARAVVDALKLRDDPVLAMIEINNESSLLQSWQWGELDTVLAGEYLQQHRSNWVNWLRGKYESDESLRASWGGGDNDGPDLLSNAWKLEVHSPSQATLSMSDAEATVRVTRGGASVIAKLLNFSVSRSNTYLAEVEMSAELPAGQSCNVYWDVKQDVSPWNTESGKTVAVSGDWKKFTLSFTASFTMDAIGRFGLSVENCSQPVHIRNWRLHAAGPRGLDSGESLESGTVSLVTAAEAATAARANDYLLFLASADRAYLNAMLSTVRDSAGERVPVAGTQMGYGGLLNFDSHDGLSFQDNHYYVDHYNFPAVAWDARDWRIRDASSLGTGMAAILNVAAARQAGLPYTVSEYNQPWPNTYSAETDVTLSAVAAFQDWDAVMHFAYSHGRNWDANVPNGFNINGDWTKFPNIGQSAWLFRSGAIRAGTDAIEIPVTMEQRLQAGREKRNGAVAGFLQSTIGYDPALALVHPVRLAKDSGSDTPVLIALSAPYASDTGELNYDPQQRVFVLQSPYVAGVLGFLTPSKAVTAGAIDVEIAAGARGYAAVLVTPLDGKPIADSGRLLVSNPGYALRSQPGVTPARPQALVNYPQTTDWWTIEPDLPLKPNGDLNGGVGPVWMERVELALTVRTTAASIAVYPLDGSGARMSPLAGEDISPASGGFRVRLQSAGQQFSPWYEIVGDPDR